MKKYLSLLLLVGFLASGCGQYFARHFGGKSTIKLEPGDKVIGATFDKADLWVLIQGKDGIVYMKEYSSMGILSGEIKFEEK